MKGRVAVAALGPEQGDELLARQVFDLLDVVVDRGVVDRQAPGDGELRLIQQVAGIDLLDGAVGELAEVAHG